MGLTLVRLLRGLKLAQAPAQGLNLHGARGQLLERRRETLGLELRRAGVAGGGLLEVGEVLAVGEELILDPLELREPLLELSLLQPGALVALLGLGAQRLQLSLPVAELRGNGLKGLEALAHDRELTLSTRELDHHRLELVDPAL